MSGIGYRRRCPILLAVAGPRRPSRRRRPIPAGSVATQRPARTADPPTLADRCPALPGPAWSEPTSRAAIRRSPAGRRLPRLAGPRLRRRRHLPGAVGLLPDLLVRPQTGRRASAGARRLLDADLRPDRAAGHPDHPGGGGHRAVADADRGLAGHPAAGDRQRAVPAELVAGRQRRELLRRCADPAAAFLVPVHPGHGLPGLAAGLPDRRAHRAPPSGRPGPAAARPRVRHHLRGLTGLVGVDHRHRSGLRVLRHPRPAVGVRLRLAARPRRDPPDARWPPRGRRSAHPGRAGAPPSAGSGWPPCCWSAWWSTSATRSPAGSR